MATVIEGQHAVKKHEHAVGHVEVVLRVGSDLFQLTHNVIRAISNRAACKWGQAFHRCRMMLPQQFFHYLKNVAGAPFYFAAALDLDLRTAGFQAQKRTYSEKGVAPNFFSALDRFKQESIGLVFGDGEKS